MNQSAKYRRKPLISAALLLATICVLSLIYYGPKREAPDLASKSHVAENKRDAQADSAASSDVWTLSKASESNRASSVTQSEKSASSNAESTATSGYPATTQTRAKSTIEILQSMDNRICVDWLLAEWTNSQHPNYQPANLVRDAFTLAFERRAPGVLHELRKQESADRAVAANLRSDLLRNCARTPKPGCPLAPEAQAKAERIDWAAAEAGQTDPMVMLWMDATNREDANY